MDFFNKTTEGIAREWFRKDPESATRFAETGQAVQDTISQGVQNVTQRITEGLGGSGSGSDGSASMSTLWEVKKMYVVDGGYWGLGKYIRVGTAGRFGPQPVHENMTIAAVMASDCWPAVHPKRVRYDTMGTAMREIVRGVYWNDDPECLLFNDWAGGDNFTKSSGLIWLDKFNDSFIGGETRPYNPIARSHNGDLQFLHAMACEEKEAPSKTKDNIMLWCATLYKVAAGHIAASTLIRDTPLKLWFTETTFPRGNNNIEYLLSAGTQPAGFDARLRALGSVIHVLQDSFAVGHTARSSPGVFSPIKNFHCYHGQDHDAHKHYDESPVENLSPEDPQNFAAIPGAVEAIEACRLLLNFLFFSRQWESGPEELFRDKLFALDKDATPANTEVGHVHV